MLRGEQRDPGGLSVACIRQAQQVRRESRFWVHRSLKLLSQPVYVGPGGLLVDAVVLHLAIYNGPDDCRDGIDSAEALLQGTIHRSTSPAGAAKVRLRPTSHIPRPHRTPSNRVIRRHLHPPATAGRRGQVANSSSMIVPCMANSSLYCEPGTMWLSGPDSCARMIMAIALAKSAITSRRAE